MICRGLEKRAGPVDSNDYYHPFIISFNRILQRMVNVGVKTRSEKLNYANG
jgi:hypothetical protein